MTRQLGQCIVRRISYPIFPELSRRVIYKGGNLIFKKKETIKQRVQPSGYRHNWIGYQLCAIRE